MREHDVVLYTREGCHLCDEAKQKLLSHGMRPQEVDIDQDPQLVQQYGECVPVVTIDGVVRFRGRIHDLLLRRLLHRS
ncbi:MAG: glutaredoxin family protein [Planctomycetales bacterium]|nr:glutaredoxin family protein [Planctomycetales bacterium]NIM07940.1 glutaredoxin family protein [Planctomycetales bacterium]NIN07419.1 glutaredoxin family protein [Planctomycetales bacterium]NIN76523.1 glutaredoxin family protein [Planctomycetales bacterium]NIO33713.1 glutaredoxin family protein [Planctomycetales bacterium]